MDSKRVPCVKMKNSSTIFTNYIKCEDFNRTRGFKCYCEMKVKISNQQKIYYEKKQKKNNVTK